MKRNWKRILMVAATAALATTMVISAAAFAQGYGPGNGTPNSQGQAQALRYGNGSGGSGTGYGMAVRGAWGGPDGSLVGVAADVLGLEQADLVAQLAGGATLAQVAGDQVDAIVQAYLAPRADFLAQRVTDGRLTQDQADAMLAQMESAVTAKMAEPWTAQGNCNGDCSGTGTPGQGHGSNWMDGDGDGTCDHFTGTGQGGRGSHSMGRSMGGRWSR